MKIFYLLASPTEIACVGGELTTSKEFGFFIHKTDGTVSSITHRIAWSGSAPGDGEPNVIRRSNAEILAAAVKIAKREALAVKLDQIDIERNTRVRDGELFEHDGHNYHIDRDTFFTIFMGISKAPDAYSRIWKTADIGADGINNIYVTMDKAAIQGMLMSYVTHFISVWDIGDAKKQELKTIALDDTKTAQDIENYDHTSGW